MVNKDNKDTGMTPEEVAEYLNCSAYTIREMSRRSEIPHYRVENFTDIEKRY